MRPWLALLFLAAIARGEENASTVTDRGRGLARILDIALAPPGVGDRALLLVVDPTPSLRAAGLGRELEAALRRHPTARPGLAVLGGTQGKPIAPGADPAAVLATVRASLARPDKNMRNVYAAARRLASVLASKSGRREMLLITLENGDAEKDLEATIATLQRAGIRLSVVAREAFLSDSYWVGGRALTTRPPKGATMSGADGAFIDVPWGWVFQRTRVTESAPSGHAMYGLSRLAAATGGRVYLFYPVRGGHQCSVLGGCHFCNNDHLPRFESFRPQRLKAIAPSTAPRREVLVDAARDPYFRAVLRAWRDASKAGLTYSRPSVKASGGSLVAEKRVLAGGPNWSGTSWRRFAGQAEKLAGKATAIAATLSADLERARKGEGSTRYRAVAEFTHLMLRITRINLLYCAAYCTEVAPRQLGRGRTDRKPPEMATLPEGHKLTGLGYWNMCLCHGVTPFFRLRLPGGKKMKKELTDLDTEVNRFLKRNAHTPFAIALARAGIARFHPTGIGERIPPAPRDVRGTETDPTTTRPDRGGGSSGGETGPTSGGG